VDGEVYDGLAVLSLEGRAALVASAIERFEPMDIETILGASPSAARRMIAQARNRFQLAMAMADLPDEVRSTPPSQPDGELARRVRDVSARAMPAGWKSQ
jgi:hypothetical protein